MLIFELEAKPRPWYKERMKNTNRIAPTEESYHRMLRDELNDMERRILAIIGTRGIHSTVTQHIAHETQTSQPQIMQILQKLQQAQLIVQEGGDDSPCHYRLTQEGRRITILR